MMGKVTNNRSRNGNRQRRDTASGEIHREAKRYSLSVERLSSAKLESWELGELGEIDRSPSAEAETVAAYYSCCESIREGANRALC